MSTKFSKRKKARTYAMQALYSWKITKNDLNDVKANILEEKNQTKIDIEYFDNLLFGIPEKLNKLNDIIVKFIDVDISKIDPIELTIIQIATFELTQCIDIPYKVAINEALELAKTFGSQEGHKFVNGVLDKVAASLDKDSNSLA